MPEANSADAAEEVDESALSAAEQARFQQMMEDAEERIAALDKWLTDSGLIKKPEKQPDEAAEESENSDELIYGSAEQLPIGQPSIERSSIECPTERIATEMRPERQEKAPASPAVSGAGADMTPAAPQLGAEQGKKQDKKPGGGSSSSAFSGASWQLMMGFGISFAVRVGFLGMWLGSYIDRRWLGDTGIGAMAIIVLVIFYSFYMLYRDLMRLSTRDKNKAADGADEPPNGQK